MDIINGIYHAICCIPWSWLYPFLLPASLLWLCRFLWQQYFEQQRDPALSEALPPGCMGWPLIGESIQFMLGTRPFSHKRRASNKSDIYKTHLFGRPHVVVLGIDNTKMVLKSEHSLVSHEWPKTVTDLLGPGAMTSLNDQAHRDRRRILLSAFKHDVLQQYVTPMRQIIQKSIANWIERGRIVTHAECKRLTFKVVSHTLVGFQYNSIQDQDELITVFDEFVRGLFSIGIDLPGFQFHKSKKARNILNAKLSECIRLMHASQGSDVNTVLASLLANVGDDALSHDDLLDEVVLLMFAGHDTTACAITLLIMFAIQHPHIVDRMREELAQFDLDDDVTPTYDLVSRLPYTDAIVREVLMQQPPIGGGFRVALKSFTVGGYQIPKGWKVGYSAGVTHSLIFTENFDPERWLTPENEQDNRDRKDNVTDTQEDNTNLTDKDKSHSNFADKHKEKAKHTSGVRDLLYFGLGSRSCVGKEFAKLVLRVFLVEFTRTCDVSLVNDDVKMKYFPMPVPKDGMPIYVKSRRKVT